MKTTLQPLETVQLLFWRLAAAAAACLARRRRLLSQVTAHLPLLASGAAAWAAGRLIAVILR